MQVEDIIKEKTEEGQVGDEFMFFDRTDDFEEPDFEHELHTSELHAHSHGHGRSAAGLMSPSGVASGPASAPATDISGGSANPGAVGNVSEGVVDVPRANVSGASTPFLHLRGGSSNGGVDIGLLIKTTPADALQHVSVVGLSIMEWLVIVCISVW